MRPNQLTTVLLDVPVMNEKFTGLAQTLGQLYGFSKDSQPNRWANLNSGPTL
jgi:hypothetical protein